jgi:hypothetical protein
MCKVGISQKLATIAVYMFNAKYISHLSIVTYLQQLATTCSNLQKRGQKEDKNFVHPGKTPIFAPSH